MIAAEISDIELGLLHLEMAALARATRRAIEIDASREVQAHLAFVDEIFSSAEPKLENAVYVSYLEDVFLGQTGDRYVSARARLSPRLRQALAELEAHWAEVGKVLSKRTTVPPVAK